MASSGSKGVSKGTTAPAQGTKTRLLLTYLVNVLQATIMRDCLNTISDVKTSRNFSDER